MKSSTSRGVGAVLLLPPTRTAGSRVTDLILARTGA
jgi:hypothetical protein